jgi:hypothetical protein
MSRSGKKRGRDDTHIKDEVSAEDDETSASKSKKKNARQSKATSSTAISTAVKEEDVLASKQNLRRELEKCLQTGIFL